MRSCISGTRRSPLMARALAANCDTEVACKVARMRFGDIHLTTSLACACPSHIDLPVLASIWDQERA